MKFIPWSGVALNAGRSIIAFAIFGLFMIITHHKPKFNRWVLIGSLSVFFTNLLFAIANKMTTAANSIVLQYTAPIFLIILSMIFLKRRASKLDLCACGIVFFGIVCFFVDSLGGGNIIGDAIALTSGLAYSIMFLFEDMPDGDSFSAIFWGAAMSSIIGFPAMLNQPPLGTIGLFSLLFLGVFQMGIAFLFLMTGLKWTPPITASLITAIEPILNPVLVAVFYGETMGWMSVVGAAIVISGVLGYNILLEQRKEKAPVREIYEKNNKIDIKGEQSQ